MDTSAAIENRLVQFAHLLSAELSQERERHAATHQQLVKLQAAHQHALKKLGQQQSKAPKAVATIKGSNQKYKRKYQKLLDAVRAAASSSSTTLSLGGPFGPKSGQPCSCKRPSAPPPLPLHASASDSINLPKPKPPPPPEKGMAIRPGPSNQESMEIPTILDCTRSRASTRGTSEPSSHSLLRRSNRSYSANETGHA